MIEGILNELANGPRTFEEIREALGWPRVKDLSIAMLRLVEKGVIEWEQQNGRIVYLLIERQSA